MIRFNLSRHDNDPRIPFAIEVSEFCDLLGGGWAVHPRSPTLCECIMEGCDEPVFSVTKYRTAQRMVDVLKKDFPDFPQDGLDEIAKVTSGRRNWIARSNQTIVDLMDRWPHTEEPELASVLYFYPSAQVEIARAFARRHDGYFGFARCSYMNYKTATAKLRKRFGIEQPFREELHPPLEPGLTWWVKETADVAVSARWKSIATPSEVNHIEYSLVFFGDDYIDSYAEEQ